VEFLKTSGAVKSKAVEKAFSRIRREAFVPDAYAEYAYADDALPTNLGQTISQPSTIAAMLELLQAEEGMKVLEVGSGSGYVLALLSEIVGENGKVIGVEYLHELAEKSREILAAENVKNVEVVEGDGAKGVESEAPFDRILVSAACPFIPKPLFDQLREGGRIVAPVGDKHTQMLQVMKKLKGKVFKEDYMEGYFVFVPLRGEHGWK
jgi:protein-L-isoaspartate(D-aspartate) O-methyltransferase